jgi:hypothetical protein
VELPVAANNLTMRQVRGLPLLRGQTRGRTRTRTRTRTLHTGERG